ncbi:hypothetical protein C8F04DRAFT_1282393 [Mycena alexandri]|uniref:Uncharacterized protein n=1 Tax=Mycena alexandri TaxID=1745969 RepID=A0AAD6RXQ2_9AGAR|nr:hypothetical protein C8F04DRAFT_1282393 [Mycena alexandri]
MPLRVNGVLAASPLSTTTPYTVLSATFLYLRRIIFECNDIDLYAALLVRHGIPTETLDTITDCCVALLSYFFSGCCVGDAASEFPGCHQIGGNGRGFESGLDMAYFALTLASSSDRMHTSSVILSAVALGYTLTGDPNVDHLAERGASMFILGRPPYDAVYNSLVPVVHRF